MEENVSGNAVMLKTALRFSTGILLPLDLVAIESLLLLLALRLLLGMEIAILQGRRQQDRLIVVILPRPLLRQQDQLIPPHNHLRILEITTQC